MDKNLQTIIESENIIKIILSSPIKKDNLTKKIILKQISKNNINYYLEESYLKDKVFHKKIYQNLAEYLPSILFDYKQFLIVCPNMEYQCFVNKDNTIGIVKKKTDKNLQVSKTQNDIKNYIFTENMPIEPFIDLGVFNKNYKIITSRYDKFKQINKFIEFIDNKFKDTKKEKIKIIDFGCGKSYLTFFVYYYFHYIKKINAEIIGYDLKADVIEKCNNIAQKYGYNNLKFYVADITKSESVFKDVDMIITLHACDIATDYALYYAIKNNVKNIFSVPCCQHEINSTIQKSSELDIILKHGIIKERFCALLTDSIRAELLNANGYNVKITEFIDTEGSLKNLMIVAEKTNNGSKNYQKINFIKDKMSFEQTLLKLLEDKDATI